MRRFLALLLLLSSPCLAQSKPNIIFFLVDDLGYGDLGCFWQDQRTSAKKFDTPALDHMAAEGAKLTHHYVSASVCAPSRASLLQGRHQGHSNVRDSQFDKALENNHTIASVLKAAGYRTIHIGKNGLAGGEGSTSLTGTGSQNLEAHPLDRGFDRFFGYLFHGDGHEHFPANGTTDKSAFIYDDYRQVTDASVDLYTTDAWTAAAKKEIIAEATDGDSQPFFLYLAYDTPHFKMQRPAVAYPALDDDGNPLTGGIQWTTATDGSGKVRYASTANGSGVVDAYTHPDIPSGWAASEKQHVGMIRRIDDSIADILRTVQDLGIDGNTICVFSSDNGPHNEGNNPRTFESFANMEGIKRDMWEAGIRAPTIVRWPGHIAGATGNENNIHEISYPSALWDWMPTFCELANVPAPAWCDGVSLVPTLTGTGTQRDKGYLYFEFKDSGNTSNWTEFPNHGGDIKEQMQCIRVGSNMGVRTGINTGTEPFRIYNVTTDPGEATNLAASLPAVQAQMQYLALTARRPGAGVSRPYDGLALPAAGLPSTVPGLKWKSFTDAGATWKWVPEFRDLTPGASGTASGIDLAVRPSDNHFGMLFTGFLNIPTAGSYTFYLDSDTGADFFLHDGHLIADDFAHSGSVTSAAVNLSAGLHPIRLYYRHATGTRTLALDWSGPGLSRQAVPQSAYFSEGAAPAVPVVLWTTTFNSSPANDGANRNLTNTKGDSSFTDTLSADDANLTFQDTSFTGTLFMNIGNMSSGTYYSPRTNVDNPGVASPQNGGWWQTEFRYTGGSQKIGLSDIVFNVLWSNSSGNLQTTSGTIVRDITLTADYSLNGGANWVPIASPQTFDLTEPNGEDQFQLRTFTPASVISVNHATQDLWLRVRAENAGGTAGAYVDIQSIVFRGNVIPPTDDYTTWAAVYPGANLTDPDADLDGDGMTNFAERAFGLNPTSGASVNPVSVPLNSTFTYTRRDPSLTGLSYAVWTTTNLEASSPGNPGGWTEDGGAVQTPGVPDSNGKQSVSVTLSPNLPTGSRLFVRVRASN